MIANRVMLVTIRSCASDTSTSVFSQSRGIISGLRAAFALPVEILLGLPILRLTPCANRFSGVKPGTRMAEKVWLWTDT